MAALVDSSPSRSSVDAVVAGRNEALRRALESRRWKNPAKVFGFVSDIERQMAAADLIVTKPGGLTSSESLALGRPLLIVDPIPGQEAANSDFLLERGAAVKAERLEDVPFRLKSLLAGGRLRAMSAKGAGAGPAALGRARLRRGPEPALREGPESLGPNVRRAFPSWAHHGTRHSDYNGKAILWEEIRMKTRLMNGLYGIVAAAGMLALCPIAGAAEGVICANADRQPIKEAPAAVQEALDANLPQDARLAALCSLGIQPDRNRNNPLVLSALSTLLSDQDGPIREASVCVLFNVASSRDPRLVAALLQRLEPGKESSTYVRWGAGKILRVAGWGFDPEGLKVLLKSSWDDESLEDVVSRLRTVLAIGGNPRIFWDTEGMPVKDVLEFLISGTRYQHEHPTSSPASDYLHNPEITRQWAVEALTDALRGNEQTLLELDPAFAERVWAAVIAATTDKNDSVRQTAVVSLSSLLESDLPTLRAIGMAQPVADAIVSLFSDGSPFVRSYAENAREFLRAERLLKAGPAPAGPLFLKKTEKVLQQDQNVRFD